MCGCGKSKATIPADAMVHVINKARAEFQKAYDLAFDNGFPEKEPIVEGTDFRVHRILDAVASQFGSISLDTDFKLVSAVAVLTELNEVLVGLESLRNLTKQDEEAGNTSIGAVGNAAIQTLATKYREFLVAA